jgi:hypothetical protein
MGLRVMGNVVDTELYVTARKKQWHRKLKNGRETGEKRQRYGMV